MIKQNFYATRIIPSPDGTSQLYPRASQFCRENGLSSYMVEPGQKYDYVFNSETDLNLFLLAFGKWFERVEI